MHALGNNQHILEAVLQPHRVEKDLLEWLRVAHAAHHADRKAAGENAVVAGSVKPLAHLHLLLNRHVVDFQQRGSLPFQSAADAAILGNHAGGEIGIGGKQDLRRSRVGGNYFADDSVRRHHGHAALDPAGASRVDVNHLGVGVGAGADHGGGQCLRRDARLKHAERLGAFGCVQFVFEKNVLQLEVADLFAQPAVFGVFVVQQDVVAEEADAAAAQQLHDACEGSDGGHGPDADDAHVLIVFHLYRQQQKLSEDHQQEDGEVAVTVDERLHRRAPRLF